MISQTPPIRRPQPIKLPPRPSGSLSQYKSVPLVCNCFKINFKPSKISCYRIDFEPRIKQDFRKKRYQIIKSLRNQLIPQVGEHYAVTGQNLFSLQGHNKNFQIKLQNGGKVILKYVRMVMLQKQSPDIKQFLSSLFKTLLRGLDGLQEIGKDSKFIDTRQKRPIGKTGLILRTGFSTNVSILQQGVFLRIDALNKIARQTTVLEYINQFYHSNKDLDRDSKRAKLLQLLKGQTVVTTYGNQKYYRIQQIRFDLNAKEYKLQGDNIHTLSSYYKQKYNVDITSLKAPLIVPYRRKNQLQSMLLIPQLLKMTGIPENCDERLRMQISKDTIKPPNQKAKKIRGLLDRLGQSQQGPRQLSKIGIQFSQQFTQVKGRQLPNPTLLLGKSSVDNAKVHFFSLYDKPIKDSSNEIKILLCFTDHSSPNEIDRLKNLFNKTSRNINVRIDLRNIKIQSKQGAKCIQEIQQNLEKLGTSGLGLVVLPNHLKSFYGRIKKFCLQTRGILTQFVLASTLKHKNAQSILTKVLLQINAKLGNVLWAAKLPNKVQKTMLMGISVNKDSSDSKRAAIGICCSCDKQISKYSSILSYQQNANVVVTNLQQVTIKHLQAYYKMNKGQLPDQIIVLREGCSQGQLQQVLQYQLNALKSAFTKLNYEPKVTIIAMDKKPALRFMTAQHGNPAPGTLIAQKVVSSGYDFYMIPQNVRSGSATPTYYKVLHNESKLSQNDMAQLCFGQCFNYANWSGSVRVPAVLQYAQKLSMFSSQYIHETTPQKISQYLYYI